MVNALNTVNLCKISAKFNAKRVRSTLNSAPNMYDLRFIKIAVLTETKVLWHNGRGGDKQAGGQ